MKFTETEIKYMSGLMDADGSLMFHFTKYKDRFTVKLKLVLQQSLSIDHNGGYINRLKEYGGFVQFIKIAADDNNWADANRWTVTHSTELNTLIPRLSKHMVIKAKHWMAMLDKLNSIYGRSVTEEEMNELKEFALTSRKNVGPLKPKTHPTWAWVAGYADGDGCYFMRTRKKGNSIWKELQLSVVSHDDDKIGLELLEKAFGGRLRKSPNENTYIWTRSLGINDRTFAIHFLRKMQRHSYLKRHKIESMLHYHQQRLSESNPTG